MSQGFELFAKLGGDASGLKRALGDAQKSVGGTRGALRNLAAVGAGAFKALSVAATAAAGALAVLTKRGLESVDAQAKLARSLDASIDGLRGVQIAASDAGVDSGALGSSLQMLNSRLAEAARGTGTAVNALDRLGLNARDLMAMDVDQRMATIADAMRAQGMSAGQASDALRELGVRSREMSLLMIEGGDSIRNAREEVNDLGLSISAVDAAKIEIANDAFSRVGSVIEGVKTTLAVEMSHALYLVSSLFTDAAKSSKGFGDIVRAAIDGIASALGAVADSITIQVRMFRAAKDMMIEPMRAVTEFIIKAFNHAADAVRNSINVMIRGINSIIDFIPGIDAALSELSEGDGIRVLADLFESSKEMAGDFIDFVHEKFGQDLPSMKIAERLREAKAELESLSEASVDAGKKVGESLQEVVAGPFKKLIPEVIKHVGELEQFGIQAARNIQDSFARFLFDPFKDGMKGMLSGFVNMLRDMVSQLLARQILLAFFGQFAGGSGLLGGIAGGLLGKQKGGPANRNTPYMVGERGPELMIPNASGTVIPNHKMGLASQGTSVNVTINAEDPGAEGRIRAMVEQDIAPQIVQAAVGRTIGILNRPSFA